MHWTVSADIERGIEEVYRVVADEREVVRWSAWPEATGFTCAIEGDGTSIGSEIVFSDPRSGAHGGRQRLAALEPPAYVRYELENPGPAGFTLRPVVELRLHRLDANRTRVDLEFTNELPDAFPAEARDCLASWAHALHVEDLRLLKARAERVPG